MAGACLALVDTVALRPCLPAQRALYGVTFNGGEIRYGMPQNDNCAAKVCRTCLRKGFGETGRDKSKNAAGYTSD
jgi:hypothetical protein